MFKLIRDNIPEIAKAQGAVLNYATAENDEFFHTLLRAKLVEEVNEYLASPNSLEELADIKLVLDYLIGDRETDFQNIYTQKRAEMGGFDKKYIGFFADSVENPNAQSN